LVPANGQWCLAAGKVTVGLASHWPRVTDISGSHLRAQSLEEGAPLCSLVQHGWLYLTLSYMLKSSLAGCLDISRITQKVVIGFGLNLLSRQLVGRERRHPHLWMMLILGSKCDIVLWHCWLGDRKGIRPVKNWMLVCWWWWFDWSFARLTAPVVQLSYGLYYEMMLLF